MKSKDDAVQNTVELNKGDLELSFARKEVRLKGLTRIYATHFSVPRPSPPPVNPATKSMSLRRKRKEPSYKYIFARDPPTESSPPSPFPVLIQRPMLSTRVQPVQLHTSSKVTTELKRKKQVSPVLDYFSPYHIKYSLKRVGRKEESEGKSSRKSVRSEGLKGKDRETGGNTRSSNLS